jgi:hypothetical protein
VHGQCLGLGAEAFDGFARFCAVTVNHARYKLEQLLVTNRSVTRNLDSVRVKGLLRTQTLETYD